MEWYYLGYVILALFIGKVLWNMKYVKTYEAFTAEQTPKRSYEKIVGKNNELKDNLNLSTHRTHYEDMIIALEDWVNVAMLDLLSKGTIGTQDIQASMKDVRAYNDLVMFKMNLNHSMKFLDDS